MRVVSALCPRSVFSAHTHLGGRVQRPLVLLLYPRVGMHELILLLLLFLSYRLLGRTWGGGGSMLSPRCAVPQSDSYGCLSPVFSPQFFFSFFFGSSSFSFSFFALPLLTPYSFGLYYSVVFDEETPELQPRWSAPHCCPDHCPLARAPLSRHSPHLPSVCPPLVRTRIPLDSWSGGSESFMVV